MPDIGDGLASGNFALCGILGGGVGPAHGLGHCCGYRCNFGCGYSAERAQHQPPVQDIGNGPGTFVGDRKHRLCSNIKTIGLIAEPFAKTGITLHQVDDALIFGSVKPG